MKPYFNLRIIIKIKIKDPEDLISECKLVGHKGIVRTLQISQDEKELYSAGTIDHDIKIWDINTQ